MLQGTFRTLAIVMFAGLAATASRAMAEPARDPVISPYGEEGFASPKTLRAAVGTITFRLTDCDPDRNPIASPDERRVIAQLEKVPPRFMEDWPLIDAVMREGARYAWRECPHPLGPAIGRQAYDYRIRRVTIETPDGRRLLGATDLKMVLTPEGAHVYQWGDFFDLKRTDEQAEAEAQRVPEQAPPAPPPPLAKPKRQSQLPGDWWVWPFAISCFLAWLFRARIAYVYYRYCTDHPAKELLDRALDEGKSLDGERFGRMVTRDALNEPEQRARTAQAAELTAHWQGHTGYLDGRTNGMLAQATAEAERETERLRAEIDLMEAAIAHEQAAARFNALKGNDDER